MRLASRSLALGLAFVAATASRALPAEAPSDPVAPVYVSMGDSVTLGYGAEKPYPHLLSAALGEHLDNLAVGGAIAKTAFKEQMPLIPYNCAFISIDIGFNDANGIVDHNGETMDEYDRYMHEIVGWSRKACPKATIAVFTIINEFRGKQVVDQVNQIIRSLPGVTVIDIAADQQLHDTSRYIEDQVHPNNGGHCLIAHDVLERVGMKEADGALDC